MNSLQRDLSIEEERGGERERGVEKWKESNKAPVLQWDTIGL